MGLVGPFFSCAFLVGGWQMIQLGEFALAEAAFLVSLGFALYQLKKSTARRAVKIVAGLLVSAFLVFWAINTYKIADDKPWTNFFAYQEIQAAKSLGKEIAEFSRTADDFLSERASRAPAFNPQIAPNNQQEFMAQVTEMDRYRRETATIFFSRYGARLLGFLSRLNLLGIDPPWSIKSSATFEPAPLVRWLGAIGNLLEDGRLKEAKKTAGDQKLWWDYSH